MENFEPPKHNLITFTLKVISGLGAGIGANLILLILFLLTSSVLKPVLEASQTSTPEVNPIFVLSIILIVSLTSITGNLLGTFLFGAIQKEKYTRRSTAAAHIFSFNIVMILFLLPLYLISSATSTNLTASIAGLQIVLSTAASIIIFEIISNLKYSLVGIYSTILAVLIGMGINFTIFEVTRGNWTILMFAAMPVIWLCIGLFTAITETAYSFLYTTSGKDFLLTTEEYGTDYGTPEEDPEEETPESHDQSGSDFLKKKS